MCTLEKFAGASLDARTILHFKIIDATIRNALPSGWEVNFPVSGVSAGANFRLTFVDTIASYDADGNPFAPQSYVLFAVLAQQKTAATSGLMLVRGLSAGGQGPYGVNLKAFSRVDRRSLRD